jgi:DNA-binding transcriptional ArsR family regulator
MQVRNSDTTQSMDLKLVFRLHAEVCKALASEHRQAILYAIGEGEMCVGDLADQVGIPVHATSQHLRIMREHGLLSARREGQNVFYRVANLKFIRACALICDALMEQHLARGDSLRAAELLRAAHPEAV